MKIIFIYCFSFLICLSITKNIEQGSEKIQPSPLPNIIKLKIPFSQSYILSFDLKEERDEIKQAEVVTDDRNGVMVIKPAEKKEHTAMYKNETYQAMFTVTLFKNETSEMLTFFGSFSLNGSEYNLIPVDFNEAVLGDKVETEFDIEIDTQKYKLSKLLPAEIVNLKNDELSSALEVEETYADIFKRINGEIGNEPQISYQAGGKQNIIAEFLLIVDVSTYQKFYRFSMEDHKRTVEHLKFYYTHIMNAVDDRYKRISHQEFSWSIVVTALYIATKNSEAPFTTIKHVRGPRNVLKGTESLQTMNKWIRKKLKERKINWPSIDAAIMFHDLDTGNIKGLAYPGGACRALPVGHMVNMGTHDSIFVTAHEIGHLMGSMHDESRDCTPENQFIMASYGISDSGNINNELLFSSCSIKYFSDNIKALNSQKKNCMLNRPCHLVQSLSQTKNMKTLMGQAYDLNHQCIIMHGRGSSFCGGDIVGDSLCRNMPCTNPATDRCFSTRNFRASDGTSCGNRQWCIKGLCISDANAPTFTLKKCRSADTEAFLYHRKIRRLTCLLIKMRYNSLCKLFKYSAACCETCEDIKANKKVQGLRRVAVGPVKESRLTE